MRNCARTRERTRGKGEASGDLGCVSLNLDELRRIFENITVY